MNPAQSQAAHTIRDELLPEMDRLPFERRVRIYRAIAELMPGKRGDAAANAAFALERAQQAQLQMLYPQD